MAKKLYVSSARAGEILGVSPYHVTVLSRKFPDEFSPIHKHQGVNYYQLKVIERVKKSGRINLKCVRTFPAEIMV